MERSRRDGLRTTGGRLAAMAIVILFFTSACGTQKPEAPVPPGVMTELLVALHLTHARAELIGADSTAQADSVLRRHGVKPEQFEAAVRHYAERPEVFVALMDTVIDRMRAMRPTADVADKEPLYSRRYVSAFRDTLEASEP